MAIPGEYYILRRQAAQLDREIRRLNARIAQRDWRRGYAFRKQLAWQKHYGARLARKVQAFQAQQRWRAGKVLRNGKWVNR